MNILYLCQRFPYPPDRGDKIPNFHYISYLSRSHQVYVGTLIESRLEKQFATRKSTMGYTLVAENRTKLSSAWGMLLSWLRGEPFTLGFFWRSTLRKRIRALLSEKKIDAIIVFSSSMAQYVEDCDGCVRIMNFCDVDSQKWKDLAERSPWYKSIIYRREAALLLKYENRIAHSFSLSCVVTDHEADLFREVIPKASVRVLQNGVDFDFFGKEPRHPWPSEFVFVGVMDYPPNIEAVTYFAHKIWPLVRERYPDAAFTIIGGRPRGEVRDLAQIPGIEVTGYVIDVRPYLARATLVLIPLGVARGIQNKILEAMAASAPVLTTPVATHGLMEGAKSLVYAVERQPPQRFFQKIVELVENPALRESLGKAAQDYILSHYSWERRGEELIDIVREAMQFHAASNPTGAEGSIKADSAPTQAKGRL